MPTKTDQVVLFPKFSGLQCLMMPYIQGDVASLPFEYEPYKDILASLVLEKGKIGFLTIDESPVIQGKAQRAYRAKHERALHTEAGKHPDGTVFKWGWGASNNVKLDRGVRILLANNLDDSCAVWDTEHANTTLDGDIGHVTDNYPYNKAIFMKAGEVHNIGILTPHESLPVTRNFNRQFLRIMSSGIHGREPYFTKNPLLSLN